MTLPDDRELHDQQAAREFSWATITDAQVLQKIADIQTFPFKNMREAYARMLAHAIATHAPRHIGLVPAEWWEMIP